MIDQDTIDKLELLIINNEDDFDRGKGKYLLRKFIADEKLNIHKVSKSVCPICKNEFEKEKGHGEYCSYDCWEIFWANVC